MLIGISGKKRSGKSTIADYLVRKHGFISTSFADPIREMLLALDPLVETVATEEYELGSLEPVRTDLQEIRLGHVIQALGWDEAKEAYPEVRRLMQRLGTEAGREVLGQNVWVSAAMAKVDALQAWGSDVVIPDVRFPNEKEAIEAAGGIVIRVNRPGLDSTDEHPSETLLDNAEFPFVISNSGSVASLYGKVEEILKVERGSEAA